MPFEFKAGPHFMDSTDLQMPFANLQIPRIWGPTFKFCLNFEINSKKRFIDLVPVALKADRRTRAPFGPLGDDAFA